MYLFLTIIFIFLVALIGTFLNSRKKDRCLKDFNGYHVTIEMLNGDLAWGKLRVFSNGLELEYLKPNKDTDGHWETSFIVYSSQYKDINCIYRYSDELNDENKKRRQREIDKTRYPSIFRRIGRSLRNIFNTFRDAFVQSIGIGLTQAKKGSPSSALLTTQDQRISQIGQTVVGHAGRAFEPILERHIFDKVVMEILKDNVVTEYCGLLKEYTSDFLEVLDIPCKGEYSFPLSDLEKAKLNRNIKITVEQKLCKIKNEGNQPIFAKRIEGKDFSKDLNVIVNTGTVADFEIADSVPPDLKVVIDAVRQVDMVAPRFHSVIRHNSLPDSDTLTIFGKRIDNLMKLNKKGKK